MFTNISAPPGNFTGGDIAPPSSQTGLAVGLSLFFLLVTIGASLMLYLFKFRNVPLKRERGTKTKQDYCETPQSDAHQYVSTVREPLAGQNPVYENLQTHKPDSSVTARSQRRSNAAPEEDLYLQCEPIYSNDPDCSLVIQPASHDEDLYIVPSS